MARDCADWTKPLARSVYFSMFIRHFPQHAKATQARSAKVGTGFASDRASNFRLARDLVAKPLTLSRITRDRRSNAIFIGFPCAALTFLNRTRAVTSVCSRSRQLEANVGSGPNKRKRRFHKFVCA